MMAITNKPEENNDNQLLRTPKISHQHQQHTSINNASWSQSLLRKRAYQEQCKPTTAISEKGFYEVGIFLSAVVTGTGCSILSKVLYELEGVGIDGSLQRFDKPLFQTLAMFAAMLFGIPMHWLVLALKIPIPGYDHAPTNQEKETSHAILEQTHLLPVKMDVDKQNTAKLNYQSVEQCDQLYGLYNNDRTESLSLRSLASRQSITNPPTKAMSTNTYMTLALLSLFDLTATALCAVGLLFLDVSVYQMLRGSGIIFVALLRQVGLKQRLFRFQWIGVGYNVISIFFVGTAALLSSYGSGSATNGRVTGALLGVTLMLAGSFVQAMQFVLEEKIMVHDAVKVPPLLLFGMEGVWGFIFSLFILWPAGYWLNAEDPFNTLVMLCNTPFLQFFVALYMLSIFGYNLFAVLVTFSLSSMWHSILDNFRPMTVWLTDLLLFSVTHGSLGESWTKYSWLELAGLGVLLYGTAIYNAPDPCSIRLQGQWYALGIDLEADYEEIREKQVSSMCSYPSMHRFLTQSWTNNMGGGGESLRSLPEDSMVLEV